LVFTTALSSQRDATRAYQINDLRKQKSCGSIRIGEVRLAWIMHHGGTFLAAGKLA
jgi:hypothetical protein